MSGKPIACLVLIVSLLCITFISFANAQAGGPPDVEWKKTYGGTASDVGSFILRTDDGGYIVQGMTKSYGNGSFDVWLVKLDASGNEMWNKTYGGAQGDYTYCMKRAPDGGYVIVGATGSFGSKAFDFYMVKVDANGNLLWDQYYGEAYNDALFSLEMTKDGGFVATGYITSPFTPASSDVIIIKSDKDGNQEHEYTGGWNKMDWGKAITVTPEGDYVVCGWTTSTAAGDNDVYATKYFANGTQAWEYKYGGPKNDLGYSVTVLPDGYMLGGHTESLGAGANDLYLIKIDRDGKFVWEKSYGGIKDEYGTQVILEDDGYLLMGSSLSTDSGLSSIYIVKTDFSGNMLWEKRYEDTKGLYASTMTKTADGGYIITGNMNEYNSGQDDMLVIKLGGNPAPAANVLEKVAPPVAAVVVGTGVGFLGLFLTKILGIINQLLGKPEGAINVEIDKMFGFLDGYIKSHLKALAFRKESRVRKITADQKQAFFLGFSKGEIVVSVVASLLLAAAYLFAKKANWAPETILLYLFASGVAIILHDLMHRFLANKYKAVTEYKFWGLGTVAMFATALLFGVVYAVPARTIVNNAAKMKPEELGMIYGAGPLLSFLIALAFAPLMFFGGWLATLGLIGFSANLVSATYSLMPFDPMDGNKVFKWNKVYWLAPFAVVLVIYVVSTILMI